MKKILFAVLVALVATVVTAVAQQDGSVGPYPLGKSDINTVPAAPIAIFIDRLGLAAKNNELFLHLEGKYDSVRAARNNLNDPFNYLIGVYRAVALRELAIRAGFPKNRIVVEPAKLGKVREVEYWFGKDPNPKGDTTVIVNNNADSATNSRQDREIAELRERCRQDSIAAANRPSTLSNIVAAITVGGGIIGRSAGSETLRGLNAGFFFQDSKGFSEEIGWMGMGSYTGQGGMTLYSLTSSRLSGDKESGIDFTIALGHSWYQREDKFDKIAPFRTKQYPFAGMGITGYTKVLAFPVRVTLAMNYQPEVYVYDGNFEFHEHAASVWLKVSFRPLAFLGE